MSTVYDEIELTPEEIENALLEGRKRKFFHLRNREYWQEQYRLADELHEEDNRRQREKAAQVRALKQRA